MSLQQQTVEEALGSKISRGPAPSAATAAWPPRLPVPGLVRSSWPTWASGAVFLVVTLIAQRSTVTGHRTETGDFAADSLRSQHAWSQVDGVFSRWGYHHPGPLLLWIKDLSETALAPLGLDPTGAQVVGTALVATVALVTLGLALAVASRSPWCGPAVLALALVGLPDGVVLVPWGPVVGNWFLVLGVAGLVAAAHGARWGVPVAAAGACGLVHLHVLFLPLAGVIALAALSLVLRRDPTGAALRRPSVALATGAVLAAGTAPLLVALVRGTSPWAAYLRVSQNAGASPTAYPWSTGLARTGALYAPGMAAQDVALVGTGALFAVAVVVLSGWLALRGTRAGTRVVGAAGLISTAFLLGVSRMDFLTPETIGRVVPVVVLAGMVAEVAARARPAWAPATAALAVAALLAVGLGRPPVEVARRGSAAWQRRSRVRPR